MGPGVAVPVPRSLPSARILLLALLSIFQLLSYPVLAQTKTVEGIVTDGRGLPLEGVTVTVKGGNTTVTTSAKGRYTLSVDPTAVLVFSYAGLTAREEMVGPRTVINVLMQDPNALENVVVVGYGTQKKINLSGAVAQVTGKDLANRPVPNVTSALQGMMPGVTVLRGSGKPGAEGY